MTDKDIVRWLLEVEDPSIRYITLRDILGRGEENPALKDAKALIPGSKIVTKIFSKQNPKGY